LAFIGKKELTTPEQIMLLLTGTCGMNNQQHMSNSSTFYTKKLFNSTRLQNFTGDFNIQQTTKWTSVTNYHS